MISGTMPFIAAVVLASITIATCTNVHPMAASAESRSNTVSDTQGCCCCSGACLYANYPPCPCPQPAPGHPLPKCQLQETIELFLNKYATLAPKNSNSKDFYPAKTVAVDGKKELTWQSSAGWTSGFYPGLLWHLANFTSKSNPAMAKMFHDAADTCTLGRAVEANDTGTHDVGFMVFGSFGQGYEFGRMGKPYAEVIVQAAHSLATRYNPIVGMTRSWGASDDNSKFEVIIDNLMNLELLFWAAEYTGNSTLSDIAVSHAKKTGEFWFREDNSTAHLCVFSPQTGKLLYPCTGTPQGYSNASTWARGQAWGIYGWTMAHRYTQDPVFVTYAEKATSYFLANVNSVDHYVPPWDFDAPVGQDYPDTSAAAITASALIELSAATGNVTYMGFGVNIMAGLQSHFIVTPASQSEAVFFGNRHDACPTNVPANCTIIETDYYVFEAIFRLAEHTRAH